MTGHLAFDSPALRLTTWVAWAAPPLWFIACASLWSVSGDALLWPLVPFWVMLLFAACYWMHLAIVRFHPGALRLALLFGLPVAGAVAATMAAGAEAGVTSLLALALLITSAHVRAAVISKLLAKRPTAPLVFAACLAASLTLPAIMFGAAIAFVGAYDGESLSIAWPRWFWSGVALMLIGLALPAPSWILERRARRNARELLSRIPPSDESARTKAPPKSRLAGVFLIAACCIPLGACGLLVAGALSNSSTAIAYAGLVIGALLGSLLAKSACRWLRNAN